MKEKAQESVTSEAKYWFGDQIRNLAIRHDLAGPDIGRVALDDYTKQLIHELQRRAGAAVKAQKLTFARDNLDSYCTRAAEELIRIRQIRAAYKCGDLSVEALRKLPPSTGLRNPQFAANHHQAIICDAKVFGHLRTRLTPDGLKQLFTVNLLYCSHKGFICPSFQGFVHTLNRLIKVHCSSMQSEQPELNTRQLLRRCPATIAANHYVILA